MRKILGSALVSAALTFLPLQNAAAQRGWIVPLTLVPRVLAVDSIGEAGSSITLEDGSVWEVRLQYRPSAVTWRVGQSVQVRAILAPAERYEFLLVNGESRTEVEARFVGLARTDSARDG